MIHGRHWIYYSQKEYNQNHVKSNIEDLIPHSTHILSLSVRDHYLRQIILVNNKNFRMSSGTVLSLSFLYHYDPYAKQAVSL